MDNNQKITVLHLISSTDFLGAERVICELASNADINKFNVLVGLLGPPQEVVDSFRAALEGAAAELVYFPCDGKISLSCLLKIREKLLNSRITILHTHGYKSDIYAFLALKLAGTRTRLIATNHTWKLRTFLERIYKSIDKTLLQSFAAIAAVSGEVRDEMIGLGITDNRISIIQNGVTVNGYGRQNRMAIRSDLRIADHELIIGCVASLTKEKAHADLIRAFSILTSKLPDVRLVLIGDGPERTNLEKLSDTLGIKDKIAFMGQRRDVTSLYVAFDIFALVSYAEGLPMAMLEAMAASLPVVVSAVGAIPMVINSKQNGILVTPGEIQGIAEAFITLAGQPELRESLGHSARNEVVANYSVTRMARDYEELYDSVLIGPP